MNFFSSAGTVIRLPGDAKLLTFFLGDDNNLQFDYSGRMAVVTSIDESESGLVQVRQMFNNKTYLNVFGDKPGFLSVSGFFAHSDCTSDVDAFGRPLTTGFELLHYYYRQHKISNKLNSIPILIGGVMTPVVYQAFLLGINIKVPDAQLALGQFNMQFIYPINQPELYDYFEGLFIVNQPEEPDDPYALSLTPSNNGLFLP